MNRPSEAKAVRFSVATAIRHIDEFRVALCNHKNEVAELCDVYKPLNADPNVSLQTEISDDASPRLLLPITLNRLCGVWRASVQTTAELLGASGFTAESKAFFGWLNELEDLTDASVLDSEFMQSEETAANRIKEVLVCLTFGKTSRYRRKTNTSPKPLTPKQAEALQALGDCEEQEADTLLSERLSDALSAVLGAAGG